MKAFTENVFLSEMRLLLLIAFVVIIKTTIAWSWNGDSQTEEKPSSDAYSPEITDLFSAPSEPVEEYQANATEVDQVVDQILTSTRQGRNVDGFDDVYSDPNIQNALQNGDDGEARNLIKERLCSLGLMKVLLVLQKFLRKFLMCDVFFSVKSSKVNALTSPQKNSFTRNPSPSTQ